VEEYGKDRQAKDDNIIRRMRFACWITKAKNTQSEYVTFIVFPPQLWLLERTSVLCLHVHCLSCILKTAEIQTANVACFQRKVQLSGFSAHPDG
jgi:hypothetical protein